MTRPQPLLVALRPLGLGDLLTAVPALRALARAFPRHRRVLAAPPWQAPLALSTGAANAVVAAAPLAPLDPSLHNADVAVNLHGRGPQSTALLAATSPSRLISFGVNGGPAWRADEHERERWCRLLAESGIAADPCDLAITAPASDIAAIARAATVIHPGAASAARRWPVERWAAVARAETSAGRPVVITGSRAERPLADEVASLAGLPDAAVLAGRTDVVDLVAVVAAAARVVCGDTGVAHVASAVGTPSVVLFGPTSPRHWGPPPGPHIALWRGRPGDPHADVIDPGLAAIGVGSVIEAIERLPRLDAAPPPASPRSASRSLSWRSSPGHSSNCTPA